MKQTAKRPTVIFLVTEDWYFVSHRLELARRAVQAGYRVVVAARMERHSAVLKDAGCEVVALPWRRKGGVIGDLRTLALLVGLYRRERPDIVHHIALKPILFGSLAAKLTGVRTIVNAVAGLGYAFSGPDGRTRILRRFVIEGLRIAMNGPGVRAIVQNPDDATFLLNAQLINRGQIVLIRGSGVDLNQFAVAPFAPGVPVVMLASRLLWDKGVAEFVDAASILKRREIRARFVLVGETDAANRAAIPQAQIDAWSGDGTIEWWGHRVDMPAVFAASHIVCLPSYREGLPKVLLEAAACGRPIVTTDVPGCREVVRNGVNGLMVPVRDSTSLAEALAQLIEDPALMVRMGHEGRLIAEREFAMDHVVGATLELYRSMG